MKINFKTIGNVLKKNAPTICAIAASIGVAVTAVLSSKAAVKAHKAIVEAEERYATEERLEEFDAVEKFKVAFPIYIPTLVAGTATVVCILTGNALGAKMQAQLLAGYVAAEQRFKKYREKTQEFCGGDTDSDVQHLLTADQFEEEKRTLVDKKIIGKQLFYDTSSQQFFWSTESEVYEKLHEFQKIFSINEKTSLEQYCAIMGLPSPEYAEITGWSKCEREEEWWSIGYTIVDYDLKTVVKTGDRDIPEYRILSMDLPSPDEFFGWEINCGDCEPDSDAEKWFRGKLPFDWHRNTEEERNKLFLEEKKKVMFL